MKKLTKYLAIPRSTRYNLFSKCNNIQENLINKKKNVKWSSVSKRKRRYPLIIYSSNIMIQELMMKHPSIVVTLIAKDTIFVRDNITGKNTNRVGKYSIQVYIRELHNALIKSKNYGGISEV